MSIFMVLVPVVAFAAPPQSDASPTTDSLQVSFSAPTHGGFSITGQPPAVHELIVGARDASFQVVIQNTSSHPLSIYTDGNSWGDKLLSFQMTTADGKMTIISRKIFMYDGNVYGFVILMPGECLIRTAWYSPLHKASWDGWPQPAAGQKIKVTLEAIFEQHPYVPELWDAKASPRRPARKQEGFWDGKVMSKPMEFTFVGC